MGTGERVIEYTTFPSAMSPGSPDEQCLNLAGDVCVNGFGLWIGNPRETPESGDPSEPISIMG